MRHAALLRGINLASHRRIGMADLREALTGAGLEDVATHLRSGNVVLTSDDEPGRLRARIEEVVAAAFDMEVAVIVVPAERWREVLAGCPYRAAAEDDPTKVHVTFLEPMPPPHVWEAIDRAAVAPDRFTVGEGVVYLHLPNGMAGTKLPAAVERAAGGVTATTRNWRTVTKVAEML